jgi:DNA-binding HxlR family transcriptional regulator
MNPNNPKQKQYNQQLVLLALIDGQWHRNKELKEKTKLTARTLSKHLNELEKEFRWIERKEDTESGEYPHPVLYRATDSAVSWTHYMKLVFDNADDIEADLKKAKDPLRILEELHEVNEYYFTLLLETIQEEKTASLKWLDSFMSFIFYSPYEIYTKEIVRAFTEDVRFGEQFNIDKLRQRHNVWDGNDKKVTIQYRMKWKIP